MALNLNNLKESNDFLNVLLNNINEAIFIIDKDFRIVNFNNTIKNIFNSQDEKLFKELCGNALGCQFVIEENNNCGHTSQCQNCTLRKSFNSALKNTFTESTGKLVRNFYINDKKVKKHFNFTSKEIIYDNQKMILLIFDDVTELEEKNIQLQQTNEQKNEFLGIASHDLRNPLGAIISFTELLLDESYESNAEKKKELLEYIHESSKASVDLLNELLDISNIESGNLHLNLENINYNYYITRNIHFNKFYAKKKDIEIELELLEKSIDINIDKSKIEQVINNLITNAVKFSFPKSTIKVKVFKDEKYLITEVQDQGQGIAEDDFHKVFKEFQKTKTRTTAGERSTGLGLAISKKIIEGHNGLIGFTSELGKGSNFYFKLPL